MTDQPIKPRFEGTSLVIETAGETEVYDAQFLVAALLVYVAKGDGTISERETEKMLELISQHFHLRSGDSLALLTRAIGGLADHPELESMLRQMGATLNEETKEEIALMMMKVAAADGKKDADEMEMMNRASEIIGIGPDLMHRAFERYFAETMRGD